MLLVALLVGALAIAGLAFGAKPPPKPKKPKPGHPAAAHAFAWHDTPTGSTASLRGLSAVSSERRLGQWQRRHRPAHDRPGRHLAVGRPARHLDAPVPRHRGVRRRTTP